MDYVQNIYDKLFESRNNLTTKDLQGFSMRFKKTFGEIREFINRANIIAPVYKDLNLKAIDEEF